MRRNLTTMSAALIGAAALLMACSDKEPGVVDPGGAGVTPTTSQPNGSAPGLPHSGAPKVTNPIADTSSFEADPCSVITPEQLKSIGLRAPDPKPEDASDGPGCLFEFDRDTASEFRTGLSTAGEREGISTLYARKANGTAVLFEEQPPVDGFPAVIAMPEDSRSDGECMFSVGMRDDLLLSVDLFADPELEQGKDPCGWAQKVAELAVQTMKGAS